MQEVEGFKWKSKVSLLTFLKDPAGDLPWGEDTQAQEVMHLNHLVQLAKLLRIEKGPVSAMFYTPWCGNCKRMKPDHQVVAKELKGNAVLAAMDMKTAPSAGSTTSQGSPPCSISKLEAPYPGGNSKDIR